MHSVPQRPRRHGGPRSRSSVSTVPSTSRQRIVFTVAIACSPLAAQLQPHGRPARALRGSAVQAGRAASSPTVDSSVSPSTMQAQLLPPTPGYRRRGPAGSRTAHASDSADDSPRRQPVGCRRVGLQWAACSLIVDRATPHANSPIPLSGIWRQVDAAAPWAGCSHGGWIHPVHEAGHGPAAWRGAASAAPRGDGCRHAVTRGEHSLAYYVGRRVPGGCWRVAWRFEGSRLRP